MFDADFIIDFHNLSKHRELIWDWAQSMGMKILFSTPTRIAGDKQSTIDNILCSQRNIHSAEIAMTDVSDHLTLVVRTLKRKCVQTQNAKHWQ